NVQRAAHCAIQHACTLYNCAIRRDLYGLESSPCFLVRPKDHAGPNALRTRVLEDAELRAGQRAAQKLRDPLGGAVQLLMLTGARRTEVGELGWPELHDLDDEARALWVVPR